MKNRIILTFIILLTAAICVHAQYDLESDFTFTINRDGRSVTITEYAGTNKRIDIPPTMQGLPVTIIGDSAFINNQLARVTIPDSVIFIGAGAFANNQLTSVAIPDSVIFIGLGAFANNQLTSVTIPNGITSVENSAFRENNLTSVIIPDSVTFIGEVAFANNQLTSVNIPNNVTSIGSYAFANNLLTGITIPDSVNFIGNYAFTNNQLTRIIIPDSVTFIGDWAFARNQLISVSIPNNEISIREDAFNRQTNNLQPEIITRKISTASQSNPALRFNTIGAALGYQGVSAFGFTVSGTVSPANYTFFDFSLGLGFNSFSFNARTNFNAFVPFKFGGWYAGIGIGAGYNQLSGGYFAGNLTAGFIFFDWLNIAYILQLGTFTGIVNHNITIGYSYRFNNINKKDPIMIGRVSPVSTQDLIILKNGSAIEARVLEISLTEIKYKRFDHLDGPTIIIATEDVLSIRYANGRIEIINSVQ